MSTKRIYEALLSRGMTHDVREALGELEAIRKAARDASAGSVTHRLMSSDEGADLGLLLEAIAKEATHAG